MNSLPLFQIDGDLLDTAEVANNYNVGKRAITQHFSRNQDELIEGIHYHIDINPRFKTKIIKWTLEGVYMLGFFVKKSEVAKEYRHKVAQAIAQARAKQLAEAETTRKRNLELTDKVADLNACLIDKTKRHKREIASYKGKLTMAKNKLTKYEEALNAEVVEHSGFKDLYLEVSAQTASLRTLLKEARSERDYFRNKYNEIYKILKTDKNKEIVLNLAKIQKELEKNYTAIGAVVSFVNDDDRYFLENNEITKG